MSAAKNLSIRLAAVGGDKVRQEFKTLGNDGQKAFRQITNVITPANDNLLRLSENTKIFNGILKQASYLAGAFLGFKGVSGTFGAIFEANKSFEQLSGSLKTVTGSIEGAEQAFALIEKFAINTPYQLIEIVEAFIQLKALGLEPSEAALTSYGNTASAFSKNILDFVGAVAAATVGEFERLKTFGIKARVLNDEVSFTFAGTTTKVKKNAADIEKYLRSLGDVNFAGAMSEQMKTMNGVLSNIEDGFEKIYRDIGTNGVNEALKSTFVQFNELVERSGNMAPAIGQTLANAVEIASSAFFVLAENADIALGLIATRLGASAISAGWAALTAGVTKLNGITALLGTSSKSAIAGLTMMSQVSKAAAVQMALTAGVANTLKAALSLIGGPAGLAIIAGYSLYKLADSHDVAKRAGKQHAETLSELKQALENTVQEVENLNDVSKNEAIASWSKKLKDAEQNIKDLEKSLKNTGGMSWYQRLKPDFFKEEWEIMADDLRNILAASKIDLEQYQERIWELAKDYPDFTPLAKSIQENILLLKAARIDAGKAREELDSLNNPKSVIESEAKPAAKTQTEEELTKIRDLIRELQAQNVAQQRINEARKQGEQVLQNALAQNEYENQLKQLGIALTKEQASEIKSLVTRKFELEAADKRYQKTLKDNEDAEKEYADNLKDIKNRLLDLQSPYQKAISEAEKWKTKALKGLDETKAGYENFRTDVENIYADMVAKAKQSAIESSTQWQDGLYRGLQDIYQDTDNLAMQTENLVKNSFQNMEDTLVDFVTTGKLNMADFVNSVISDMMRMALQYAVLKPLLGASMGFLGIPMAHGGGIIGKDTLSGKAVNPAVFSTAPRFHSGGLVGDEVPIIAKRGEGVFTKGQMEALGAGVSQTPRVIVNVFNNTDGTKARAEMSKDSEGNLSLNIIVEQIEASLTRNITRGEGIAPVLEQRYALNPAFGSYR